MKRELGTWCPQYVTTGFVAKHCGVSNVTVLRWIERDRLPAFRLPDGHYRIYRSDFTEFLAKYGIPIREQMGNDNKGGNRQHNRRR